MSMCLLVFQYEVHGVQIINNQGGN